jgi:hypothetical protein
VNRRDVLTGLAAGSIVLTIPVLARATLLAPPNKVSLRCLGTGPGAARYLDGRTGNGTVGLAPQPTKQFSGTKWQVFRAGDGVVALQCLGLINGPRWLDGRTADGTVGLAPNTKAPFTGTRWQIVPLDDTNPDIVALKCLGNVEGRRWLDGRTADGSAGLAPTTDPPFTGTRWEVRLYPVCIDEPCQ